MPMPALLTQTGTGVVIWYADWMQNPFSIGVGLANTGGTGTVQVDVCFQSLDPNVPNSVATASSTAWFNVIAASSSVLQNAIITTPCQALRMNVVSASATTVWTGNFVQATFGR